MVITTFTLIYVAIGIIWAFIMDKLIDNALKRNPEALEEALSKVSHRDAVIINGVIWPISLVILISSFIKSLFK